MSEKTTNPELLSTQSAEPKSKALVVAKKFSNSLCNVGGKAILFFSPPGTDEEKQEARERKAADKRRREEWRRAYPREWRDYIPRLPNPIGFTRISILDELMRSPEGLSVERVRLQQRTLLQILRGQRNVVHDGAASGPRYTYKYTTTSQTLTEGPNTMALRGPRDNQNELVAYLNRGSQFSSMFYNWLEHSEEGQYEEDPYEAGRLEIMHYQQGQYEIHRDENGQYYGVPYPEENPHQTGRPESPYPGGDTYETGQHWSPYPRGDPYETGQHWSPYSGGDPYETGQHWSSYPGGDTYETGQSWSPYPEEDPCQIGRHGTPYPEEGGYETGQFESPHYEGDEDDLSFALVAISNHSSQSGEQEVESEEVGWVAMEGPENQPNVRSSEEEDNGGT